MQSIVLLFMLPFLLWAVPRDSSVTVKIPYIDGPEVEAVLKYDSLEELADQVRLQNVRLQIEGDNFYPAIHIAAYQDEVSGSAICRALGFGNGVLGFALPIDTLNTFSMNRDGQIESITLVRDGQTSAATDIVICDKLKSRQ